MRYLGGIPQALPTCPEPRRLGLSLEPKHDNSIVWISSEKGGMQERRQEKMAHLSQAVHRLAVPAMIP